MIHQKALYVIIGTVAVAALLVLTHVGEFWPFSIYPMFSRGGHPWVRSVVRDVSGSGAAPLWTAIDEASDLPGDPYPLEPAGINQNDIANFVSKSDTWDAKRLGAMRKVFGDALRFRHLLIYRADGNLNDGGQVRVKFTPFILITPDTTYLNPDVALSMSHVEPAQ